MSIRSNLKSDVSLGSTDIKVSRIGIGTNRWRKGENDDNIFQVYDKLLEMEVKFFDTAEIYTSGKSEELLGDCLKRGDKSPIVASKYMPNENRKTKKDFLNALDGSLKRLGVKTIDLYYIHSPPKAQSIEEIISYMAEALDQGYIKSIGVSNFDVLQMTKTVDTLKVFGLELAANQVEYSLLNRDPEKNGVLDACKAMNISLVAYRPLARGKLTSSAMSGGSLGSGDKNMFNDKLSNILMSIAQDHNGAVGQVSINWLLHKSELVIPIPGATNLNHALKNVGALNWKMTDSEYYELEEAAS